MLAQPRAGLFASGTVKIRARGGEAAGRNAGGRCARLVAIGAAQPIQFFRFAAFIALFKENRQLMYVYALTIPFLLMASVALGFLKENWFLELGLAVVVASVAASMILAFRNGMKAKQAEVIEFESYLPKVDTSKSHTFKFTAGLMGVDTNNPIAHLQKQIDEIKNVALQDEQNFRAALGFTDRRVSICFAQLRYHEEVTLPRIIGEGAGAIVLAGTLTIVGSTYLAFPKDFYNGFAAVAGLLKALA